MAGPIYPKLGWAVAKFRKIPRISLTPAQRDAYSATLVTAIAALQRAELQRELPSIRPHCASGTWHNNADGKISEAIRAQQRAALLAYPDKVRRARTQQEWRELYQRAMQDKRKRIKKIGGI